MALWKRLLVAAGLLAGIRPAEGACPAFDPPGLVPGMTLADARRILGAEEDGSEVAAVGDGFETIAYFRKLPARIALIFPGKVTARSKVGLAAVRSCVPIATFDGAGFASRLRDSFGEPTSGSAILGAGMVGGDVVWSDPACAIDVRAWRKGSWYDPASEAWCVEQRTVRPGETAASAPTPPPAPAPTVTAPAVAATAAATPPPVVPEPAVERPAEIVSKVEPLPEPTPPPAPPQAQPESLPPTQADDAPAATAPVLVASVPPRYPEMLRQRRLKAHVVVRATIGTNGSVEAVEVVSCDRPGFGLEQRVTAAVRQWRYKPATQRGTPVTSEIQIPFAFD